MKIVITEDFMSNSNSILEQVGHEVPHIAHVVMKAAENKNVQTSIQQCVANSTTQAAAYLAGSVGASAAGAAALSGAATIGTTVGSVAVTVATAVGASSIPGAILTTIALTNPVVLGIGAVVVGVAAIGGLLSAIFDN
jgi:hypothetical protein